MHLDYDYELGNELNYRDRQHICFCTSASSSKWHTPVLDDVFNSVPDRVTVQMFLRHERKKSFATRSNELASKWQQHALRKSFALDALCKIGCVKTTTTVSSESLFVTVLDADATNEAICATDPVYTSVESVNMPR